MTYQLGKLPAVRPAALATLETYAAGRLPEPPAEVKVPGTHYPIDGNDRYGDCTMAGVAHLIAAWDVISGVKDKVPSESEILKTYFSLSGGQDSGLVEADVLKHWHSNGLFGRKILGYAPVGTKDLLGIHQSVALYGGCYLGIECPESAQEQFEKGDPWTYVEGSPVEGGHCIVALGYEKDGSLLCATWGSVARVTPSFLAHYLDECWAVLPHQYDSYVNIKELQDDLTKL